MKSFALLLHATGMNVPPVFTNHRQWRDPCLYVWFLAIPNSDAHVTFRHPALAHTLWYRSVINSACKQQLRPKCVFVGGPLNYFLVNITSLESTIKKGNCCFTDSFYFVLSICFHFICIIKVSESNCTWNGYHLCLFPWLYY